MHHDVNNYIITSFLEGLVVLVEQQPEGSSGQRMQVAMHQRMPVAEMMHAGTQSCSRKFTRKHSLDHKNKQGIMDLMKKFSLPLQASSFPPEHIDCREQQ